MRDLDQHQEWQRIWEREGMLTRLVNWGRGIYNRFFLRFFSRFITPETRIVELGCGTSSLLLKLAPRVRSVTGLDITPASIMLSQEAATHEGASNANFVLGDCLIYPFAEEYDLAWSQGLMEHFNNPEEIARAHYRALKPGGVALISVPYRYSYHALWYLLTRPRLLRPLWPWTDQIFHTKQSLRAIGKAVTPHTRVYLLPPFFLGLAILELRK